MHLKYPQRRQFYVWEELSCLCRSLGFHHETVKKCIPDEITTREAGISHMDLMRLIGLKFFNDALDRTANMHTADYNINSIKKSLELLNHRLLSFDELNDVRVAFQVYEAGDMRGMMIDQQVLMRTLKLANRTVAPLKLMHRVKHMLDRFDEPGRLQFYEFLDLIVLCELSDEIDVPDPKKNPLDKTWRHLFELDEFDNVFATYDEKLENYMNQLFVQDERNYGKEKLGSNRIPKESAVETSARKKLVRQQKMKYKELHKSIHQSTEEVQRTKAGVIRPRPISAPDVENFRLPSSRMTDERRPLTAAELLAPKHKLSQFPFRPHSAPTGHQSIDSSSFFDPRMKLLQAIHEKKANQRLSSRRDIRSASQPNAPPFANELPTGDQSKSPIWESPFLQRGARIRARAGTPLVVTEKDLVDRQSVLDCLQYEIQTLEERTVQKLEQQLDQMIPNYRHRKKDEEEELARQRVEAELKAKRRKKKKPLPVQIQRPTDPEVFDRITHKTPTSFFHHHNNNCNAITMQPSKAAWSNDKKRRKERAPSIDMKTDNQFHFIASKLPGFGDSPDKGAVDVLSTVSSTEETNSVTQTSDIVKRATFPYYTARVRAPSAYDPEKYRTSRVGTAAVIHDYFRTGSGSELQGFDSNKEVEKPKVKTPNQEQDRTLQRGKIKDEILLHEHKNMEHHPVLHDEDDPKILSSKGSGELQQLVRVPSKLLTSRSSDIGKSSWERTTISRKMTTYEDDELKFNGVPLSEIDKLTLKSDGPS